MAFGSWSYGSASYGGGVLTLLKKDIIWHTLMPAS